MKVAVTSRSFSKNALLRGELLKVFPDVRFNDEGKSLKGKELIEFLSGSEAAIVALERIDESILKHLPDLRIISKYGVGLDMIDLPAMRKFGKRLGWFPGVNKRSVAELALAQMIGVLRKTYPATRSVRQGEFNQIQGRQLSGLTVGIIGCGHIGQDLVRLLQPFSCPILVNDILDRSEFCSEFGAMQVSLNELLGQSDVISLHVPLNESTRFLIGPGNFAKMKHGAVLINMARGGIVCERSLKEALKSGALYGGAFDVFEPEPPVDAELIGLPNFVATPHIGGSSEQAVIAMGRSAIYGLQHNAVPDLESH